MKIVNIEEEYLISSEGVKEFQCNFQERCDL